MAASEPTGDELLWGSDDDDEDLEEGSSEGEEEEEHTVPTRDLLRAVRTGRAPKAAERRRGQAQLLPSELYEDSAYGVPRMGVVEEDAESEGEGGAARRVGVDDLAEELRGSAGELSGATKAHLSRLSDARTGPRALRRPESDVEAARRAREAGYAGAREAVAAWQPTVRANREADHLHFPLQETHAAPTTAALAGTEKKRPAALQSDLERRVREVLEQSGISDAAIKRYEAKLREEQRNPLTDTDTAAAASAREPQQGAPGLGLKLYYQQLKAMWRNKIKSKSYRRLERARKAEVRAAAAEELRQADPDAFRREQERMERARTLERATLKHRRDSKWAKQQRIKGLAKAPEVRAMLAENARIGRELARKMESVSGDMLPESPTEDPEDVDDGDDAVGSVEDEQGARRTLRDDYDDVERAEEAAAELAREEAAAAAAAASAAAAAIAGHVPGGTTRAPVFSGASAIIDAPGVTRGRRVKVSDNVTVSGMPVLQVEQPLFHEPSFEVPTTPTVSPSKRHGNKVVFMDTATEAAQDASSTPSNPWLAPSSKPTSAAAAAAAPLPPADSVPIVDMTRSADDGESESDEDGGGGMLMDSADPQQRQLVREAFAADDSDLEREFEAEKNAEAEEAVGTAAEAKLAGARLPGWGHWIGEGVVEEPRAKARREREEKAREEAHRKKVEQKRAIRRDAAMRHVVINERTDKKLAQFQVQSLPSGETPQHHERMIAMPVGKEWQTVSMHNRAIVPPVVVERGAILQPLSKTDMKKPQKRPQHQRRHTRKDEDVPAAKRPNN